MIYFEILSKYRKRLICCFIRIYFFCRRGKKRSEVYFRRIRRVYFLSNAGDDAACAQEKGGKVFISHQSRYFLFVDEITKVLFLNLYNDLACRQFCFSPRKSYKQEKQKYSRERSLKSFWLSVDSIDCDWLFFLNNHIFFQVD